MKKKKDFTDIRHLFIWDVVIEKVLVRKKISFGEKNYSCFIGSLLDNHTDGHNHNDGQTKWMYFLIEDDDSLEKYNTIWDKVSAYTKKDFDSEPVYNKKFLKTKIKSHGDEITDF